jgi:hypothetical protein
MTDRRIDAFFYGLYMDVEVLREANVVPVNPRRAYVDNFTLRIGQRATLLPAAGARAYGMLIALSHQELERLYTAPGLEQYRPEAVLAQPLEGARAGPLLQPTRSAGTARAQSGLRDAPAASTHQAELSAVVRRGGFLSQAPRRRAQRR